VLAWDPRVRAAVVTVAPFLAAPQAATLARLVSALLARRTLGRSELARASPVPTARRGPRPHHARLPRLPRRWRGVDHGRGDAVARRGRPARVGLAVDWTRVDPLPFFS
jgi:hypothetical protein